METYDACRWFDDPGKGINGRYMRRFLVPGAIFSPVRSGHLIPGVIESIIRGKHFHLISLLPSKEGNRYRSM